MAKKPKGPTFKDMLTAPTWSEVEAPTEGAHAVRPGRFNLSGEFFDPQGARLEHKRVDLTPREAKKLVLKGALVAHEGCGCGGDRGCSPVWLDMEDLARLKVRAPPTFLDGSSPTWIDAWKSDHAMVVYTHGDVEWGGIELSDRWAEP